MNNKNMLWLLPILFLIMITPFTPWLDMTITGLFYHAENPLLERFSFGPFFDFAFNYLVIPAWVVFILSALFLVLSYVSKKFKSWQSPCLVLLLTFIVGAGFFTHLMLKDHWGRPRPKQVSEFGGIQEFRPYYSPNFFNQPEPSKSFPCGHCTMGFYFFALALIGKRLNKKWMIYAGYSLAIGLGTLLGSVRIMQGGHFFSDVLFSACLMWLTALSMDFLVYSSQESILEESLAR
jgi:membrane-associated PAP2 superfamily phosphatase